MELDLSNILKESNCKVIGHLNTELLDVVSRAPVTDHKEQYIHKFLNSKFAKINLTESFDYKLVLIYDEVLPTEILLSLHSWFLKQACNINNIFIITTHTLGAKEWYQNFAQLFGQSKFNLLEATWISRRYQARFNSINNGATQIKKNLEYYFSYYGGSYTSPERDFICAMMLTADGGKVDYMGGFGTDISAFDNYAEQMTNFLNRSLVDKLISARSVNLINSDQKLNEWFNHEGYQWDIDKTAFAQVIRETTNLTPYATVTEKTICPFVHFQIPVPLGGVDIVDNLVKLGFNMDYNIVDYSYQKETVFYNRLIRVIEQINNLSKYTLKDLEEYIFDNSDKLQYNYDYISSGNVLVQIKENILKELQ